MKKHNYIITFFLIYSILPLKAQEFVNGELTGIITGLGDLPNGWSSVPYGDPNCIATNSSFATPDLTNFTLPTPSTGIIGNPYSGSTFVSGVFAVPFPGGFFQEGIMQTVFGFVPGNVYPINFHQAVVKQANCLDVSGSWAVYIDTILAAVSVPTYSPAPFNSTSFIWESRTISFTATSISHTIKFLPMDDDSSWTNTLNAGIRMGIDCIFITTSCDSVLVGINDNLIENSFEIYPNPINSQLNIKTGSMETSEFIIYDISSRKLFQQSFLKSITINTEHFARGIYLYEIRNKYGVVKKGKVLKD